jgi:hypothetical protein
VYSAGVGTGRQDGSPSGDHASIDGVVAAFFAAFDNRDGLVPDAAAFVALFVEGATIAHRIGHSVSVDPPAEFFRPRHILLTNGTLVDFHEWEEDAVTTVHGGIASRTSVYRKSGRGYGGTGTKLFQLARRADGEWRIVSVLWEDDSTQPGEATR